MSLARIASSQLGVPEDAQCLVEQTGCFAELRRRERAPNVTRINCTSLAVEVSRHHADWQIWGLIDAAHSGRALGNGESRFLPSARDGGLFERRRQLAPGGPTVAGDPRESTPGRVPWSRAWIPAREALERHTGDSLLDALVQASTGHNAARRPPRPGWSASELRPAPSCTSASAVAAAGPSDGRQSLPSACCRGRARDSCRGAECSGEPGAAWVTK